MSLFFFSIYILFPSAVLLWSSHFSPQSLVRSFFSTRTRRTTSKPHGGYCFRFISVVCSSSHTHTPAPFARLSFRFSFVSLFGSLSFFTFGLLFIFVCFHRTFLCEHVLAFFLFFRRLDVSVHPSRLSACMFVIRTVTVPQCMHVRSFHLPIF